jgi:hypothetical protein
MVRRLGVGVDQVAVGAAGKARDGAFPVQVLLATAALAALAVAGGLLVRDGATLATPSWPTVVVFLLLLTAAGFPTLQFQYRDHVDAEDLFEAILVPAMFVLPPLTLVVVVGIALAVSEWVQRIHPVKACYNIAQWTAAAGRVVLTWLRDGASMPTTRDLLALAVATVVTTAVNILAFVGVLWLTSPQPLPAVLAAVRPLVVPVWLIGGGINLAFGMLFVAAYAWNPLTAVLFLVPLGCSTGPAAPSPACAPTGPGWPASSGPPTPWPCP